MVAVTAPVPGSTLNVAPSAGMDGAVGSALPSVPVGAGRKVFTNGFGNVTPAGRLSWTSCEAAFTTLLGTPLRGGTVRKVSLRPTTGLPATPVISLTLRLNSSLGSEVS